METGHLGVSAPTSFGGTDWTLRLGIASFHGAGIYPVVLNRTTSLLVVLNAGATTTDQARVAGELSSAPGVISVEALPTQIANGLPASAAPPAQLRVTVGGSADIDGVLPIVARDTAVNPIFTAIAFDDDSETGAPGDIMLTSQQSVPLHAISGTISPSSDGHTGKFDIEAREPFTTHTHHLVGQWACPLPPPSLGTAGANLGTPAAMATINDSATSFTPATMTVHVGQIIEWTVPSGVVVFNVTFAADPDVTSGPLHPGATWEIRFTRPGTYSYTDTIHPGNNGVVVVTP